MVDAAAGTSNKPSTASQKALAAPQTTGSPTSGIANNFQSFLKLLTTQLQHQNPLSPLDTNQFTQQLVQFAGVEQQIKTNSELTTLVSLQQAGAATQAISLVGHTAMVDGSSAKTTNGQASWSFTAPGDGDVTVTIVSPSGQSAYERSFHVSSGPQQFRWDGRGNDGIQWPDGIYRGSVAMVNGTGKPVALLTQVSGTIESVDLSQSPPLLSINGRSFTINQVRSIQK